MKINSLKLRLAAAEQGFTVNQLAKASGVAFVTVVKARKGGNVSEQTLVKLAKALGVEPTELLTDQEKGG